MENNINNNVASNTNPVVNNGTVTQVNPGVVANNVSANPNVSASPNVSVQPMVTNTPKEEKNFKNFYIGMFVVVGIILLAAVILLVLLLTGNIGSRNRLICTKTTEENGYTYKIVRSYVLENKIMQKVYYTYTFEYDDVLTDEMYNLTFGAIINNDTHGSTKYGFGTTISKDDNVVTITAYEPSYWKESYKELKETNKDEGYTCR